MIHYHGGPVTPNASAIALWKARHAMVSFARPDQIELAAEVCQSFALDNGAFSHWKQGGTVDFAEYLHWARRWSYHPGFDWALIPDSVDGGEEENDDLIYRWKSTGMPQALSVPVWHLHEPVARLAGLCSEFPRVALGSSGRFSEPGTLEWWGRMSEALNAVCDDQGRPPAKLHGLRMLNPTIFSQLPLSSADSTAVARNIGLDSKWDQAPYAPRSSAVRALILADRIETHASAATWQRTSGVQCNFELIG